MTTTTKEETVQSTLNKSDLTDTADILAHIKAGYSMSNVKAVATGLTSLAAQDITSDDVKANSVITGISPALADNVNLPPIGAVVSVNVTAGTAAAGPRIIGDAAATPSTTVATLSDDGTTLTFEAAVTAITVQYQPRAEGMTDSWPQAAP